MRRFVAELTAALAILMSVTSPCAGAPGASDELAGTWRMVVPAPQRAWIFLVHLRPDSTAWSGTLEFEGFFEAPLHAVRVADGRVGFILPPLDSLAFEGSLDGDVVAGKVIDARGTMPVRLVRETPPPKPANRIEAWEQDLELARTRVLEYDRSFDENARREFERSLAALKADLSRMNDAQILVALSRAVALGGNAHTRLRTRPTAHGAFATELPLRLWQFDDGPYVIRAAPEYRAALGRRLVAIDGHAYDEVAHRVRQLFAGNDAWASYLAPIYMTKPDVLLGLGLMARGDTATLTLQDPNGERVEMRVPARSIDGGSGAESWQDLSPTTGTPGWSAALSLERTLPLHLRHLDLAYWFDFDPQIGRLYFQFNRSSDDRNQAPFRQFADSLVRFIGSHPVREMIVDLRFNTGGDLNTARSFMKGLADLEQINRRDRLFVITGKPTFSAGLYHAAQLRQYTQATFVGEPVGDELDFWAEGGRILLPNSGASIHYSNGFHRYSTKDYPQHRPYYEELRVESLQPHIAVAWTSADYFAGRDPALAAIDARKGR